MKNLKQYGLNTNNKTYIVAEIGINHGGSVDLAKQLIESASRAGVDAVKFQTYLTEKRAPAGNKVIFDILKKCELNFEVFSQLKEYSRRCGVEFFSTPFDEESLDYLESINCALYKVASFDTVNHKLLAHLAKTAKPVIMSVGMSNLEEIQEAYDILHKGIDKIILLHCVSAYPTQEKDANLAAIGTLKENFDCVIGQSDHTSGIEVPLYAVAAGAQAIEKHFKIDDAMDCVDVLVSITETQMAQMVKQIRRLEKILGSPQLAIRKTEKDTLQFRRRVPL